VSREVHVEHELWRLLMNVLEKRGFSVEGVRFGGVEPEYMINRKRADLAILLADKKPVLIIEVKRKVERRAAGRISVRTERRIDPTSRDVIDQALWYAIHAGAPFFATTNGKVFALFSTPERGEPFSIEKHRILIKEITLNEVFAEELLRIIARLYARVPVPVTPLDWAFIVRLRSFVNWLSSVVEPCVRRKMKADEDFKRKYDEFSEETGYKPGPGQLAKEMAYIFMNKIVFYKILERYYPELGRHKLKAIPAPDPDTYLRVIYGFFDRAVRITKDFEPVFYTGLYDEMPLPDDELVFETINAFIEDMDRYKLEELSSDVVGFIYEELIPAEERHQLGQFYTPPAIAELIVKWAVRRPSDVVLDPGCGSGTFLIKAYGRLLKLKGYREPTEIAHREILSQLYAIDINPFPLHLTALNLAMRYIRAPCTEMNTILSDFFEVRPGELAPTVYTIKTPAGEEKREIKLPAFDAVVGNPPYTRWTEIPDRTKEAIKNTVGSLLSQYGLSAQVSRGVEPGIYVHFIMWAHKFLKPGGRLGMIISDSWLQTDYGVDFGRFLLENFKVKALIDISARVFPVPLIGACIVLLEKPEEGEDVDDNEVVFVYLSVPEGRSLDVDEVLRVIEEPEEAPPHYIVRVMRQGDIPRDQKWINFIFRPEDVLEELEQKTVKMGELFEPSYGNAVYLVLATRGEVRGPRNLGSNVFFYLRPSEVANWGIEDCVYPAIKTARYARFFTFTREDWERLREQDKECYVFMAHKPLEELSEGARAYIKWGETECTTGIRGTRGGGKRCSEALACQERAKPVNRKWFYGWYDLGGVMPASIFMPRYTRYKQRFELALMDVMLDEDFIALIPKADRSFTQNQLKALCAYLNSSFIQLYLEAVGRVPGGLGPIAIEASQAREIPVIDPRALDEEALRELAALFDKLERRARELGGADRRENIMELWDTVIAEIDYKVAEILGLPEALADMARQLAKTMMERRLARAEEARPGAIKGEEEPRLRRPRRTRRREEPVKEVPLDTFMRSGS